MPTGVLLALLSFSIYSLGDSITKSFTGGNLSVFEIGFFVNVFAFLAMPLARRPEDRWSEIFKFNRPLLMNARALSYMLAALCFYYGITHIPLAETYSLAFLAPLFITFFSVIILREKVSPLRWGLVILSFVGVLIVVRPGFRELGLGHVAAVGCAIMAATASIILRILSNGEKQVSIVALNLTYQVVVNGALMLLASFVMPDWLELLRLATVGVTAGFAQILLIRGMQRAPANQIGPTQYVQIVWAVALGAVFYHESQDVVGYAGLALLILAGIATIFSDGAEARISGRWAEFKARRGEPANTPVEGPEL